MNTDILITPYTSNDDVINEVAIDDKVGRLQVRSRIDEYAETIKSLVESGEFPDEEDEVNSNGLCEYFAGGSYIRELLIPKNMTIVSQIWKKERMWIIATGEVTFTTELGTKHVKAPYTEVVPAGIRVALYTHEDTLWFAITGSGEATHDNIKDEVITDSYDECTFPWEEN